MKLKLGPIWGMSGVENFYREVGWPYHRFLKRIFPNGFSFNGVTFVAKTTTVDPREGNMPMKGDGITPKEQRPACIAINLWNWLWGVMLNAVGLSGPGAGELFRRGIWQRFSRDELLMLSFMAVEKDADENVGVNLRLGEYKRYLQILSAYSGSFGAWIRNIIQQINVTCPNVCAQEKSDDLLFRECWGYLNLTREFFPWMGVIFKINVFTSPEVMKRLETHPNFAGVCVSNTIPWAKLSRWQQMLYFPLSIFTGKSPLHRFGGGGLSGKPILPLVEAWVRRARAIGFSAHINAGGGIQKPDDVTRLKDAGADSVSIGAVATLRPWRLCAIKERAYRDFPQQIIEKE